jgi:hypothetical protein
MSDVNTAWDAALANPNDVQYWRVLADVLLAHNDPRGEWLQIELEREQGPLKGLAKARAVTLTGEYQRHLPPGAIGESPWRTLFEMVRLRQIVPAAQNDPRWRLVPKLFLECIASYDLWRQSALAGEQLVRLQTVLGVEEDVLTVMADGRARFPALEKIVMVTRPLMPGGDVVMLRHQFGVLVKTCPRLREVWLRTDDPERVTARRFEALATIPLQRVEVHALHEQPRRFIERLTQWRPPWQQVIIECTSYKLHLARRNDGSFAAEAHASPMQAKVAAFSLAHEMGEIKLVVDQ